MPFLRHARLRTILLLAVAAVAAASMPAAATAVVPVSTAAPALTFVAINTTPGDQSDPHLSGNWAAYTDNVSVRYYNFTTNTDAEIPHGPSERDLLSDVSGSKIVFARFTYGVRTAVMTFDAATGAAPVEIGPADPGATRFGSAIGGNTVAYIDYVLEGNGELVIHDLSTSTSTRITDDTAGDGNPAVSPDGNVVVWEHCTANLSNCDIWQAVKAGTSWTVSAVAATPYYEVNPDTNGTIVVYDSLRTATNRIFWRPVAGGPEMEMETAGISSDPNIAGNTILFERRDSLQFATKNDVFAYDISSNREFRITNTSSVNEELNDITVLPGGGYRTVWASNEDASGRNIRGAAFQLADPATQIGDLITKTLVDINAPALDATLKANLQKAIDAIVAGNKPLACAALQLYITAIRFTPAPILTAAQRADLIADATRIRAELGC